MELDWQRTMLADAYQAQGKEVHAKALWRTVLADRSPDMAQPRAQAAAGLIGALLDEDSTTAALALADREQPGAGVEQQSIARLAALRARALTDAGRPADAEALARRTAAETEKSGDLEWALAEWTQAARAARRAGDAAAARDAIAHGTEVWERSRSNASGLEFREVRGEQAHALMIEAIGEALAGPGAADERLAEAFAILQRFKTRTLLEHLAGPGAAPVPGLEAPLPELAHFRRQVLAPDELLLEIALGRDTSFVFAISRDTCLVRRAAGEHVLANALAALRESAPGGGRGAGTAYLLACERLGAEMLGGLDEPLASHPSILVAADGALHRSPVAAWREPGSGHALFEAHRLSLVPSASVLALLRSRAEAPGPRLLAMAGGAGRDGAVLPGARREVEALASNYADVDRWLAFEHVHEPLTPAQLARYGAIHFAGHSRVDEQLPWRSGLLLGAAAGGDSVLTAERIAAGKLGARLVVLSSCESGGGRAREGEGVSGLASAFLTAGSRAVVATLWAVEDRATEKLMRTFYDGLAHGLAADLALGRAQAALRADPATADPFYWSGFVLVGDGRTTLPLRRRPHSLAPWIAVLEGLGIVVLAIVAIRRTRPPRRVA
jgi:hypothetical protein